MFTKMTQFPVIQFKKKKLLLSSQPTKNVSTVCYTEYCPLKSYRSCGGQTAWDLRVLRGRQTCVCVSKSGSIGWVPMSFPHAILLWLPKCGFIMPHLYTHVMLIQPRLFIPNWSQVFLSQWPNSSLICTNIAHTRIMLFLTPSFTTIYQHRCQLLFCPGDKTPDGDN